MGRGARGNISIQPGALRRSRKTLFPPSVVKDLRDQVEQRIQEKSDYSEYNEFALDLLEEILATQKFYHAAPSSERSRVLAHGLIPSHPDRSGHWGSPGKTGLESQPTGIYALNTFEGSEKISGIGMLSNKDCDIWEISAEDIESIQIDWSMCSPDADDTIKASVAIGNRLDAKLFSSFEERHHKNSRSSAYERFVEYQSGYEIKEYLDRSR